MKKKEDVLLEMYHTKLSLICYGVLLGFSSNEFKVGRLIIVVARM
jgi:hypothetical protein